MKDSPRDQIARMQRQQNRPHTRNTFRDGWEDDFDKGFNRLFKFGAVAGVVIVLLNLIFWTAVVGVGIWAVVELVQWVTAQ